MAIKRKQGEEIEKLLKRFRRKVGKDGVLRETRDREYPGKKAASKGRRAAKRGKRTA